MACISLNILIYLEHESCIAKLKCMSHSKFLCTKKLYKNFFIHELKLSAFCADDIMICKETKEVEQRLECWRYALEKRKMKVSMSKTKYL